MITFPIVDIALLHSFRLESLPNLSIGQILTIPYIVPDEINSDILHKLAAVCLVIRNSLKFLTHLKNYV